MPLSGLIVGFRAFEQVGVDCKALGACWQTYWIMEPTLIERSTGCSVTGAPMTECANSKKAATEARRTMMMTEREEREVEGRMRELRATPTESRRRFLEFLVWWERESVGACRPAGKAEAIRTEESFRSNFRRRKELKLELAADGEGTEQD